LLASGRERSVGVGMVCTYPPTGMALIWAGRDRDTVRGALCVRLAEKNKRVSHAMAPLPADLRHL